VEPLDEDLIRYFQLCSFAKPRHDSVESLGRWMAAVKPLIKDETRFLEHPADFVTIQKDVEDGALEKFVERSARSLGLGNKV
jgi:hypothetical protein